MQHVLISANKGVVSLFSLYCLRVPREERGVGFLRRFCPVAGRMAFWETWVGRWRSGEQHRVTRCFLHRCLLFVYLQNERHGHLSLSLSPFFSHLSSSLLVLPTALSSVFVFLPLFSKLTSSQAVLACDHAAGHFLLGKKHKDFKFRCHLSLSENCIQENVLLSDVKKKKERMIYNNLNNSELKLILRVKWIFPDTRQLMYKPIKGAVCKNSTLQTNREQHRPDHQKVFSAQLT